MTPRNSTDATVAQRLAAVITGRADGGVPPEVRHQAKRLILNACKGSVSAFDHPVIRTLLALEQEAQGSGRLASVLWLQARLPADAAAFVNAAMLEILDFNENHTENGPLHPTAPVLPAVLAEAQQIGAPGAAVLDALAIGVEIELAVASMLMWSAYQRGFMTGVLVGGVGAAAAVAALHGLSPEQTTNALGFAMTCALGAMENFGSAGHATNTGLACRNGLLAATLARHGLVTAPTAFEGKKGMLSSYSDEPLDKAEGIVGELEAGSWQRIFEPAFKSLPTETITHAPVECVLDLVSVLPADRRRDVRELRFRLNPLVAEITADRYAQFGRPISNDLQAKFDQRLCVSAAWVRGRFTHDEMTQTAYDDQTILDVRDRVSGIPDPSLRIEQAMLEAHLADGTVQTARCSGFRGSPLRPLSDGELADLLRFHAVGRVEPSDLDALIDGVWHLDELPDMSDLLRRVRAR